jgi:hypothetical protein
MIGNFYEKSVEELQIRFKMGQKYGIPYMKRSEHRIADGDIDSP